MSQRRGRKALRLNSGVRQLNTHAGNMNIKSIAIAALGSILAACASDPVSEDPQIIRRIGDRFVGSPLGEAVARYGTPHRQSTLQGMRVYTWDATTTRQWRVPVTTHTSGTLGSTTGWPGSQVPYYETTRSHQYVNQSYSCQLDIYTDEGGKIVNVGVNGQQAACSELIP